MWGGRGEEGQELTFHFLPSELGSISERVTQSCDS